MKTIVTLLLLFVFIIKVYGQQGENCRQPINISTDSLTHILIDKFKRSSSNIYAYQPPVQDSILKLFRYNCTNGFKLDSIFSLCQKYSINKLGEYVYCNYVSEQAYFFPFIMPGQIPDNPGKIPPFWLYYFLEFPNLKNEHEYQRKHFNNEMTPFGFTVQFSDTNNFTIEYPRFLPDCDGTTDCGFQITLQEALSIAQKIKFIKKSDTYTFFREESVKGNWRVTNSDNKQPINYYFRTDGIDWIIQTDPDEHGVWEWLNIDLKTGKPLPIRKYIWKEDGQLKEVR